MFTNVVDAISWIESVKRFGDKYDLSRMELACKILGNPEKKVKYIHVAGTNGKGSTVSYLKHILLEHGYQVGTYTSPYIVRYNERITYNYDDITDEELLFYINKVNSLYHEVIQTHNQIITFFELTTLMAFMFYADKKVDFVVCEVGLGGRLDATNVITPLISVITNISYDHMHVLGNTLEEIALNKLGIVKQGIPLVTTVKEPELLELFQTYTNNLNAKLTVIQDKDISDIKYGSQTKFNYKGDVYFIEMLGNHQVRNAVLAIEVIFQLNQLKKTAVSLSTIKMGLLNTFWPGRLECFGNIVLDGAHNTGGMTALKESVETLFKGKTIKVLYTSMADKEYYDIIHILDSFASEIHFTQFDYPRCETAQNLYDVSNHPNKFLNEDALQALHVLKDLKKHEILLVTGSLYFISLIRKNLK
ncbi:MAG: bifunctional folylpolyglutamate synthase/dihydrofolate synthase [Firmicutes bacterium]|nr:bifunctional folylpolyglutamate synthase/dihydrofolate synthase [Bacillota bacterium]